MGPHLPPPPPPTHPAPHQPKRAARAARQRRTWCASSMSGAPLGGASRYGAALARAHVLGGLKKAREEGATTCASAGWGGARFANASASASRRECRSKARRPSAVSSTSRRVAPPPLRSRRTQLDGAQAVAERVQHRDRATRVADGLLHVIHARGRGRARGRERSVGWRVWAACARGRREGVSTALQAPGGTATRQACTSHALFRAHPRARARTRISRHACAAGTNLVGHAPWVRTPNHTPSHASAHTLFCGRVRLLCDGETAAAPQRRARGPSPAAPAHARVRAAAQCPRRSGARRALGPAPPSAPARGACRRRHARAPRRQQPARWDAGHRPSRRRTGSSPNTS